MSDLEENNIENTKKEKSIINKNKYLGKDLYIIENGNILKINYKDLKDNDYILQYNKEDEFYLIDRDKRKIRPFVEDLINQMNIETLQTKLIKATLIFIVVLVFVNLISFFVGYSSKNNSNRAIDILSKIEKIQMKCDKPALLPNNEKNDKLQ